MLRRLKILKRPSYDGWIVVELSQPPVAGKTKHASNLSGLMVMVDVSRNAFPANCTKSLLMVNQPLYFASLYAVAKLKKKVPMSTVESVGNLLHPGVVARLAICSQPVA
jgi:hypothetical protein